MLRYESQQYLVDGKHPGISPLELDSRIYASTDFIDSYFADEKNTRPFVQCEFIHAMGDGPGDIEDYMEQRYKYDGFCGGFAWEWCDHAVYGGTTPEGKAIYRYGGDFNDPFNDGNFCMDGLVYPDRTPHIGLLEYKNCLRPIRAKLISDNKVELTNVLDFSNIADIAEISYEIAQDGETLYTGKLEDISIKPHESKIVDLPYELDESSDMTLTLIYTSKSDTKFFDCGYELGFDEIILNRFESSVLTY